MGLWDERRGDDKLAGRTFFDLYQAKGVHGIVVTPNLSRARRLSAFRCNSLYGHKEVILRKDGCRGEDDFAFCALVWADLRREGPIFCRRGGNSTAVPYRKPQRSTPRAENETAAVRGMSLK